MPSYKYVALYFITWIFSCNTNQNKPIPKISLDSLSSKNSIDSVPKKEANVGVMWSSDYVKIIGDSTLDTSKVYYTAYKFQPYISFEDFKVPIYKGQKASINYKSNLIARQYRTIITETYKREGQNFGGHYCFAMWGCGMPCQGSALIDLKDGKVYEGVEASRGYEFYEDSKMLIINPPDSTGFYEDWAYGHPEIWIWSENKKNLKNVNLVNNFFNLLPAHLY